MSVDTQSSLDVLASAVATTSEHIELAASAEYNRKRSADEGSGIQIEKKARQNEDQTSTEYNSSLIGNEKAIADQLRISMKLKEQQEALINARRRSVINSPHPQHIPGQSFSSPGKDAIRNGSAQRPQLPNNPPSLPESPRTEGVSRGLKIWTESPFSSPTTKSAIPSAFAKPFSFSGRETQSVNGQQPNYSPPLNSAYLRRPPIVSLQRGQFMQFFESLYDSFEKSEQICYALQDQSQKAATMIAALRNSGNTIEALVAKHFRDHHQKTTERLALALTDLNRRVKVIEEKLEIAPSSASSKGQSSPKSVDSTNGRQIHELVNPEI